MRLHSAIILLGAALSPASAQSLSELPACAQQAGLAGIDATGCGVTNTTCICDSVINGPFITTLENYIETHCDVADQAAALGFAKLVCPEATGIPASVLVPTSTSAPIPVATIPGSTITALSGTATSMTSVGINGASGMISNGIVINATGSMVTPAIFTGGVAQVGGEAAVVVVLGAFVAMLFV